MSRYYDVPDVKVAEIVMANQMKSSSTAVLLLPRIERLEGGFVWEGQIEMRAKGIPSGPEGRKFLVTIFRHLLAELDQEEPGQGD